MDLAAGTYQVLVHSNSLETSGDDLENLVSSGIVDIPTETFTADVHTGATLEGRALDADGRPLSAGEVVFLSLPGWRPAPYRSTTDAGGFYRFRGLLPDQDYLLLDGRSIHVGAAGSITTLDLEDPGRFDSR